MRWQAAGSHASACRRRRSLSPKSHACLVGVRGLDAEGNARCRIVDSGHKRHRDLALELPDGPLEAVMSNEVWTQIYDRLTQLVREHRTTLVFVNTRRQSERVARHLSERLDTESVAAHHGSLARELRFNAEQRLKRGELKVLVATASLELGIDIGDVDLVCQLASPRSINAFLQRVGRSGHAVGGTPKGRLFPLSRDDLVECTALLDSVRRGELDRLKIPQLSMDVLSQQIVAEVATRDCSESELFELCRNAYPYRALTRQSFDELVHMLAEGFTTRRGRHGALLYHDGVNRMIRARKGARLTAITSGGAIPDTADYQVMLEPEGYLIGTVNEDFAVESMSGDVFQLGNSSYRILRVERSAVRVEDARGEAPTIPFWLGEAPGRTDQLSVAVSRLRTEIEERLESGDRVSAHLARGRGRCFRSSGCASRRVSRRRARGARQPADASDDRVRALLRRSGRHAAGHSLAVRQPHQSRLGTGAAQALLPHFQLRAAGSRDRRHDHSVADHRTQLRAR